MTMQANVTRDLRFVLEIGWVYLGARWFRVIAPNCDFFFCFECQIGSFVWGRLIPVFCLTFAVWFEEIAIMKFHWPSLADGTFLQYTD